MFDGRGSPVPDGFIGNDNLGPVLDLVGDGLELSGDDLNGLASLALLQALSAAEDDAKSTVNSGLGLAGNERVVLLENNPALRVAQDGPVDATLLELLHRDLTSKGAVWLVVDVLGSDLDALGQLVADQLEVDGRGGDNDLWRGCQ